MGRHDAPDESFLDHLKGALHCDDDHPGHLLPDDEWARVVAEAEAHPDNPNGGQQ